jgi:hypothetical protein
MGKARRKDCQVNYNWFDISNEDRKKWEGICPPGEYRVLSGSAVSSVLAGVLPKALYSKYNSVFIAGSATLDGNVYYMANGNRVDASGSAIDQMPFGLAFVGNSISGSGCLIQHGDYMGRTTKQPRGFWDQIKNSGTASYYPLSELPSEPAGKLTDLKIDSQNAAFGKLVDVLKGMVGE